MIAQTRELLANEEVPFRKSIYRKNLQNQELTLEVAGMYQRQLLRQRDKVANAQSVARENVKVARNTYSTVMLSSALYGLMENGQESFDLVMKIQVPEIVPFENRQIRRRYDELTEQLMENGG
jgi:hypothetical protein